MTVERSADGTQSPDSGSAVIGRAFRRSLSTFVIIAILVGLGLYLSKRSPEETATVDEAPVTVPQEPRAAQPERAPTASKTDTMSRRFLPGLIVPP